MSIRRMFGTTCGAGKNNRRKRPPMVESLESRLLLTGELTNALISDTELDALLAGLDGVAAFGSELSATGALAEPLALLSVSKDEHITIHSVLDIGDVLAEKLAGPVRGYLEALAPADRDTDGLVAFLAGLPEVNSIMGGQATAPTDEIRFDLGFHHETAGFKVEIEFPDTGLLRANDTGDMFVFVSLDVTVAFGIDLDSELNSEQAFFLRGTEMNVSLNLHESGVPLDMTVGFLQVDATVASIDIDADLSVRLNNVVPDALGNVTLSELNGYAASDLAEIDVVANSVAATVDVTAAVGSWTPAGTPQIMVGGSAIGTEPMISTNADFAELLYFNNVDAEQLLVGLETFGAWLAGFQSSSILDVDVPFTVGATLGNTVMAEDDWQVPGVALRDANGLPVFDTVQEFANALGVTYDYDVLKRLLVFPITVNSAPTPTAETLTIEFLGGRGVSAAIDAVVLVTPASSVRFDLGIDLTLPGQVPEEQFSADGLVIEGSVDLRVAGLQDSARYGMVGLDFADGTYTGTSAFRADIVDPIAGDSRATLGELLAGLGAPETLLAQPLVLLGSTTLTLDGLTVQDGLFALPVGAALTLSVPDFAQPTVTNLVESGIGVLGNFANLTAELFFDSAVTGLTKAAKWAGPDFDALVSIGVSMADLVETTVIETTADAVQLMFDTFEERTGAVARLQDLGEVFSNYGADIVSDVVGLVTNFTTQLIVDPITATFEFRLTLETVTNDETIGVGLDIAELSAVTGEAALQGIGEFSGEFDPVEAAFSLNLNLDFQFDLSVVAAPQAFLLTTSDLTASVYLEAPAPGAPAIELESSIGVLGVTFDACSFVIAADRLMPDPAAPATFTVGLDDAAFPDGRVPLDQLASADLETAATGQADFNCQVTVAPSTVPEANPFHFRIGNLNNPLGSTAFIGGLPDFPSLAASVNLETTLDGFPAAIDALLGDLELDAKLGVFGLDFPLIGDKLDGIANVIRLLRERFNFYFDLLTTFDVGSIEAALEDAIADLRGFPGDRVDVEIPSPDEILFTIGFVGARIDTTQEFSTDLGLPALGASFDAMLSVVGTYDVRFTIGVSRTDGIFIDTSRAKEIDVDLDVNVAGAVTGRLGFIDVTVTGGPGGSCDDDAGMPTAFHAEFSVGLTEPSGDDRLKVSELGDGNLIDAANTGLDGCADFDLDAEAAVADWLPSVVTGINIDWEFDGTNLDGNVPAVTYDGVGLKLGTFLSRTIGPVLDGIDNFFDGICPVVDAVTAPLPIIREFTSDPDSIIEFATFLFPSLEPLEYFAELADSICTLSQAINVARTGPETIIQFGDLRFGFDHDNDPATLPAFDPRQPDVVLDLVQQVALAAGDSPWQQVLNAVPDLDVQTRNVESSDGEISFPIIQNPLGLFEYLLGFGSLEVFAYRFPTLDAAVPFNVSFPILCTPLGCLNALIVGDLSFQFNLAIGYDTEGFERYQETGNVGDLFRGFYVSDRSEPDGSGRDISELELSGTLLAGPSFGIPNVLEAYVAGGVEASLGVDLIDPDGDGKVHGDEFVSPIGCMRLLGEIGVRLEAGLIVGPFTVRFPFEYERLGGFNELVQCSLPGITPPPLTSENLADLAGGQLTLLMGPRGGERSIEQNETDEAFTLVFLDGDCDGAAGGTIFVQAFDGKEEFCARDVDSIFADAAVGNDMVGIDSGLDIRATLLGGAGDDVLLGGDAADSIDGGAGDDILHGNGGGDSIFGQDDDDVLDGGDGRNVLDGGRGHDSITGGDEPDVISGGIGRDTISGGNENSPGDTIDAGDGDDIIYGGLGDDVITTGDGENIAFGDGGMDTISGGAEIDRLYGGPDADSITGAAGDDVIVGDDGPDHLFGGDDNDLIDGGLGADEIAGERGDDELFGGDDGDTIRGNIGADYIEGGSGDDPSLDGGVGDDTIRGGSGDDVIAGDAGSDLLQGDDDEDEIHGHAGSDTIEGGANRDFLYGDEDSDLIRGGDGNDVISGGESGDELYGDAGSDTIHGNSGLGNNDTCDIEFDFDPDTIHGGTGGDEIKGDCDNDLIFGEDGRDEIEGNAGQDTIEGGTDDDVLAGDAGFDSLLGDDGSDEISGGSEDDTARGGPGNDTMRGDSGADLLFGDGGRDLIEGGAQADTIDGGADEDHLIGNGDSDDIFGNVGSDIIEGNDGGDVIRGNRGEDLIYGDAGPDDIAGGPDNDTIRGGEDNDTARGGDGDDLILGHTGDDDLFGDDGNDVLYGYLGDDTATGGVGNDRAYGELGKDVLIGEDGDDILEGGPGDDTASGGIGRDALYGDGGIDSLAGGDDDDFLFAGDGVGDVLLGENGNDHIVGSDEGSEDPNFADAILFGDVIFGGEGDDFIEGLGGSDIINGDAGIDTLYGGTHVDQLNDLTSEPNVIDEVAPQPALSVSTGPDLGGHWVELSGSASAGGLTQVGGFEQAIYVGNDNGVYMAWVDWRNGNSEIYLAFHASDANGPTGDWIELDGSASGGGISRDDEQSRRPTIVEVQSFDANAMPVTELLVAWTKIDAAGTSSIEVRRLDDLIGWDFVVASPAPAGSVDDPKFVLHSDSSALLGWLESSPGGGRVGVAEYVRLPGNAAGNFLASVSHLNPPPGTDVTGYDLATDGYHTAVAYSHGDPGDHDVTVNVAGFAIIDICAGPTNCPFPTVAAAWTALGTFTDGNAIEPTVGVRFLRLESQGQFEVRVESDVYAAWHEVTDRSDQVIAVVARLGLDGVPPAFETEVVDYRAGGVNEVTAPFRGGASDTIGYAAKPDLAAGCVRSVCRETLAGGSQVALDETGQWLAWMDDSVHGDPHIDPRGDSSGRSSLFVVSAERDSRVLEERLPGDASGTGISPTGGSINSVSITMIKIPIEGVIADTPYVAWTEYLAGVPGNPTGGPGATEVMLRTDLDLPQYAVSVRPTGPNCRLSLRERTCVTEGGAADTYSIVLMSQPASNVAVDLTPSTQVTVSAATLIFTPLNWSTPQVVTVTAVNDQAREGSHTGSIAHSARSLDANYNGLDITSVSVQIRDNDFGITAVTPQVRQVGRKRLIARVDIATIGVTDPAAVSTANLRLSLPTATSFGKVLALRTVTFDAATEIATITPVKPLALNKIHQLTSRGGLGSFTIFFGAGNTTTFSDLDGDIATLTLSTPRNAPVISQFVITRGLVIDATIQGTALNIVAASPTSVLSGSVRRGRGGDGKVTLQNLTVAPGTTFRSSLTNPPFKIGPLPQTAIDELLIASGGTLAGVLIPV